MSTITPMEPMSPPNDLGWVPSPQALYRLSIEQYEAMVASGVFRKRDRFHLINGFLVGKMTAHRPHSAVCETTRLAIEALLPATWHVRNDRPLRIPNATSVPEPDIAVVRGTWRDYARRHPEPADVALVVEIAASSVYEDRGMAGIYGAGSIADYWIVNLVDRQIEVYSDPDSTGYRSRKVLKPGENVPFVIEDAERGRIAVDDVMPRRLGQSQGHRDPRGMSLGARWRSDRTRANSFIIR